MQWKPIEDLPEEADRWASRDYLEERARWDESRRALQSPNLDKRGLELWTQERHRLFAVETGQIENLYTMRLGMTEMLVTEGLENARSSHTVEGVLDDETLQGLLRDQHDTMDRVFRTVKGERPLSESVIKEWHALLTRHQDTAPGIDPHGRRVGIPFLKGAYKRRPNNPRMPDGTIHEYCPPEQVTSEMERLLAMHRTHERTRQLPAPVEAAWLHHRFVQIHPFEDGNGRTARLLMSYVFARRGEPTPVIAAAEKPEYFGALQRADRGDLRAFARMLETRAVLAMRYASDSIRNILTNRHEYFHINGDLSARDERGEWNRHIGVNLRESLIEVDSENAAMQDAGERRDAEWYQAQLDREWPAYRWTETSRERFTLAVQEADGEAIQVLGEGLTFKELVTLEREHRGWPPSSERVIGAFAIDEIARAREPEFLSF